jgi:hypothetical protein
MKMLSRQARYISFLETYRNLKAHKVIVMQHTSSCLRINSKQHSSNADFVTENSISKKINSSKLLAILNHQSNKQWARHFIN